MQISTLATQSFTKLRNWFCKLDKKAKIAILSTIAVVLIALPTLVLKTPTASFNGLLGGVSDGLLGGNYPDAQWFIYNTFTGWKTKADPSKIGDGDNANGQNTVINDGDRISIRDFGSTVVGEATTTEQPVISLHTFRKRSGENILIRTRGTYVEYFEEYGDTWEALTTTSTAGSRYGFADYNINTDLRSYVYWGNSIDNFTRWTGAHTYLTQNLEIGTTTIYVADTTNGFDSSGTLMICGTSTSYSAKTNTTFTITTSTVACSSGRGVASKPQEYPTYPKGNIYLVANNRLFIAGITSTTQAVYFSKYGDPLTYLDDLVDSGTADAAGIFNLGEGGGAVTGLVLDENSIYILKPSIIYKATLDDSLYTLQPLKPFDGRSQTTGALAKDSVFTGGNGVFFITPDKQIMNLTRVDGVDYPQIIPISEDIKNTTNNLNYSSSTGIFWQNSAYISVKSENSEFNDTVLVWNFKTGAWESPIIGWQTSDWTIYNNGSGEALYFGDALTANVYKVTPGALDNNLGVTASWRSKQYDFGSPHQLKELTNFYIEGYSNSQTNINISLLLDENGDTQTYSTTFKGTESSYFYDADVYNPFGYHPFGYERFGSSDASDKVKFRIYLNKNLRINPFYNIQLDIGSDGENQAWEVTGYGFQVRPHSQPEKYNLIRSF